MNSLIKYFCALFMLCITLKVHGVTDSVAVPVQKQEFTFMVDTSVHADVSAFRSGLLYDVENKKIVWQKDMDASYPIASLTKMMVALLAVEDIKSGKFTWNDEVSWMRTSVIKKKIGKRKYKRYTIANNVTYSLCDVFKNTMIASNNEASEQMARFIGAGDMMATVDRMNVRAHELGMTSTYYGNPSGLPGSSFLYDNSSSCTDLLTLTMEMLKHPEILDVTGLGYTDIGAGKGSQTIRNHNRLTIDFTGDVDGMKTGYTKRAGFCLVATVKKCNHRLISIVLGSRDRNMRNEVVKNMVNDYYASIGLDALGPYNFYAYSRPEKSQTITDGNFTYVTKDIKKIHKVRPGEHLTTIAGKYNCSVSSIKSWNHLRSSKLMAGQKLTIHTTVKQKVAAPKDTVAEDSEEVNAAPPANPENKIDKTILYTVQQGDTLFNIARRYDGVTVEKIKEANNISDDKFLKVGAKIKVPVGG